MGATNEKSHAKFSPSGAERWLQCPHSLTLPHESTTSSYASEGTMAHDYAAWVITDALSKRRGRPSSRLKVCSDSNEYPELYDLTDSQWAELKQATSVYWSVVNERVKAMLKAYESVTVYVEQYRDIPALSFVKDIGGTPDCMIVGDELTASGKKHKCYVPAPVQVIDFKYGTGVEVYPDGNKQLMLYAASAMSRKKGPIFPDTVVADLIIVQPRSNADEPVRSASVTNADMVQLFVDVAAVHRAITGTTKPQPGLHCRWCPAKASCEAVGGALDMVQPGQDLPAVPDNMDDLVRILRVADAVTSYLKECNAKAYELAMAGVDIPGFKLVEKRATRVYSVPEEDVIKWVTDAGVEDPYKRDLLSPAQMEKKLTKEQKQEFNDTCVSKVSSGTTLVPDDDKRPRVSLATASDDDFAQLPQPKEE